MDRPIFNPSEGVLTYTATMLHPASKSIKLAQGAINKMLQQYGHGARGRDDVDGMPLMLTPADVREGLELSEVSLFIDAAFSPAKTISRRWLQVCTFSIPLPSHLVICCLLHLKYNDHSRTKTTHHVEHIEHADT